MTRILSVFNLLKRVGFAVLLLGIFLSLICNASDVRAQTWELTPGLPNHSYVTELLAGPNSVPLLAATLEVFQYPETGGIYKYDQATGSWILKALEEADIDKIKYFDIRPGVYYACTQIGLAASTDEGESWDILPNSETRIYNFAISPHDSMLWAACFAPASPRLEISENGGETWESIGIMQAIGGLEFSHTDPDLLYVVSNNLAREFRVSSREFISEFVEIDIFTDGFLTMYQCRLSETIYVLTLHHIFKFDIASHAVTDSIQFPTEAHFAQAFAIDETRGITVATDNFLYELPLNLSSITAISSPISGIGGRAICFDSASGLRHVSSDVSIYREQGTSTEEQPSIAVPSYRVYPNPAREMVVFNGQNWKELRIYNTLGQLVQSYGGDGSNITAISLKNMTTGNYWIQVIPKSPKRNIQIVRLAVTK